VASSAQWFSLSSVASPQNKPNTLFTVSRWLGDRSTPGAATTWSSRAASAAVLSDPASDYTRKYDVQCHEELGKGDGVDELDDIFAIRYGDATGLLALLILVAAGMVARKLLRNGMRDSWVKVMGKQGRTHEPPLNYKPPWL
jgi:hypothetical protein